MQFRGNADQGHARRRGLTVAVHTEGFSRPIHVAVGDEVRELRASDHHTFALKHAASVGQ